jgi:hypothetical protein
LGRYFARLIIRRVCVCVFFWWVSG